MTDDTKQTDSTTEITTDNSDTYVLFEANANGQVTHVNGKKIPDDLIVATVNAAAVEQPPMSNSDWVLRGAYSFANQLRSKSLKAAE